MGVFTYERPRSGPLGVETGVSADFAPKKVNFGSAALVAEQPTP